MPAAQNWVNRVADTLMTIIGRKLSVVGYTTRRESVKTDLSHTMLIPKAERTIGNKDHRRSLSQLITKHKHIA